MKQINIDTMVGYGKDGTDMEAGHLQKWAYDQLAAAPDLLEACKMALSCMAPEDDDITARKLRQAIAKAEEGLK